MPTPRTRSIIPDHTDHLELPAGRPLDQLVTAISQPDRLAAIIESSAAGAAQDPPESEIALEAYSLFEARGCQHGHDVEDWLAAEALVRQRSIARAAKVE